jgi:hypothetical protein
MAPSLENSNATWISPLSSAAFVKGPPTSSGVKVNVAPPAAAPLADADELDLLELSLPHAVASSSIAAANADSTLRELLITDVPFLRESRR